MHKIKIKVLYWLRVIFNFLLGCIVQQKQRLNLFTCPTGSREFTHRNENLQLHGHGAARASYLDEDIRVVRWLCACLAGGNNPREKRDARCTKWSGRQHTVQCSSVQHTVWQLEVYCVLSGVILHSARALTERITAMARATHTMILHCCCYILSLYGCLVSNTNNDVSSCI